MYSVRSFPILFFTLIFFFSTGSHALASVSNGSKTIQRGGSATINWALLGAINCTGTILPVAPTVNAYPSANGDSVSTSWVTQHSGASGSVTFNAVYGDPNVVFPQTYTFTCTDPVSNTPDSANLTINDCSGATPHWNGTSCVVAPPTSCPAQTTSNCSLPATLSGSSAGSCATGYGGSCNFSCFNGVWTSTSNTCVASAASFSAPPSCVIPDGASSCHAPISWTSSGITRAYLTDTAPNGYYTDTPPGPQTYSTGGGIYMNYGGGTFQIRKDALSGIALTSVSGTATCAAVAPWNGSICQAQYTITASAVGNGSVSPNGTTNVLSGGSQVYTITPNPGYAIVSVNVDGANKGVLTTYTFSNVTSNHTISATFAVIPVVTSFGASPNPIDPGQTSYLTWSSTGATACAGTGFATGGAISNNTGVAVTPPITSSYQIGCTGPGGSSSPQIATVTVTQPQATITASETRVRTGSTVSISWTSSGVQSCEVKKNGVFFASGKSNIGMPDTITSQSTYTLTCTTKGNSVSSSTTVNVLANFQNY